MLTDKLELVTGRIVDHVLKWRNQGRALSEEKISLIIQEGMDNDTRILNWIEEHFQVVCGNIIQSERIAEFSPYKKKTKTIRECAMLAIKSE